MNAFQTQFDLNVRVIEKLQYRGTFSTLPSIDNVDILSKGHEGILQFALKLHCDMARALLRGLLDLRQASQQKSLQEVTDRYYAVQGKAVDIMRKIETK